MGDWKIVASAGTVLAASVPDPPNVLSTSSASVFYGMYGNGSAYGFNGSIDLPTSNPDYAHLKNIHVVWVRPAITSWPPPSTAHVEDVATLYGPWSSSPKTWDSGADPHYLQDGSSHSDSIVYLCDNDLGTHPASPVIKSVTVQASAVTSISSLGEIGTRFVIAANNDRLPYLTAACVPVLSGNQVPQNVTFLLSDDGGSYWTHIGATLIATVGQQIKTARPAPGTAQTWKFAVCTGFLGSAPTGANGKIADADLAIYYPGIVRSAGFSVAAMDLPSATDITSITVASAPGSGAYPYNAFREDGSQYWSIPSISINDTNAVGDPNAFYLRLTTQDYDASGNPVGDEGVFDGAQVSSTGKTWVFGPLMGEYGTAGSPARSGPISKTRLRLYECNRVDPTGDSWKNVLCSRLQTGVGGGAGYVDVVVSTDGTSPSMYGTGMAQDSQGIPMVNTSNPANMLYNGGFENGLTGWTQRNTFPGHSGDGTVTIVTSPVMNGTKAAAGTTATCKIYQRFVVRPGDTFYYEAYYCTTAGATGGAQIAWWELAADGVTIIRQVNVQNSQVATTSWTKLSGQISAMQAGTTYLQVEVGTQNLPTTGTWYFDNLFLCRQASGGTGLIPDGSGGLKINSSNPANMLYNGGFENDLLGWTNINTIPAYASDVNFQIVTSPPAITGTKMAALTVAGQSGQMFQDFAVHAGDRYYVEMYYYTAAVTSSYARIMLWWMDSAGNVVAYGGHFADGAVGGSTTPAKVSGITPVAPAGTSTMRLLIGLNDYDTGTYYFDSVFVCRQVSTGDGMAIDSATGAVVAALADGLTIVSGKVAPNLGGGLRVNPTTKLVEVNNADVTAFASTVRPVAIFTSSTIPALPDANYPVGSYGFNTTTGSLLKVNSAGTSWVSAITSSDTDSSIVSASYLSANYLTAGAIAAAYASFSYLSSNYITASAIASNYATFSYLSSNYASFGYLSSNYATIGALNAKTITADKITGGTCSATVSFTAPSIQITSGQTVINIDSTNYVMVQNANAYIWTQMTSSAFRVQRSNDAYSYSQMGLGSLSVSGPSGTQWGTFSYNLLIMTGLPSYNPGAGSKQFWYDPSDGNRVKFAA
jgi:hypothetical protein